MPLTFHLSSAELTDETFIVTVSGEADAVAVPQLQRELDALADDGARELIVDMLQVPFLDSTILGVLLRAVRRMRAGGGDVVLISDDPRVLRTFEISGLVSSFRLERNLSAAVERVVGSPVGP